MLHGALRKGAVGCIVLRQPDIIPTGAVIRIAACGHAAAEECVCVRYKLGVVERNNCFVMRQTVANQF